MFHDNPGYAVFYKSLTSGPVVDQSAFVICPSSIMMFTNSLSGSLPESLVELRSLTGTLNLSYNKFSDEFRLLMVRPTAFSGNPNLCWFPLENLYPDTQNPRAVLNDEENPKHPKGLSPIFYDGNEERRKEKNGSVAVPLISSVSVWGQEFQVLILIWHLKLENLEASSLRNAVKAFQENRPLSEILDPTLLTEVHAKKPVLAAFHIALNCTELDPELRPRMRTVSEILNGININLL
ncbi:Detected protein of unknown function [Hibiscus syriacus]|uniref:non-specific serine/threonine protein kinase n=1 Tax=Hibiscus syriacus TaxID=106335 RepID=A0A6A2ZDM4_HIBSY|nr:Detected protein of unknown function [Hibiscus syriacus]